MFSIRILNVVIFIWVDGGGAYVLGLLLERLERLERHNENTRSRANPRPRTIGAMASVISRLPCTTVLIIPP